MEGVPAVPDADKNKVMHASLPILGGMLIMATNMPESMGQKLVEGNNFTISLNPDTKEEADRLYKELSEAGQDGVAPMTTSGATGIPVKTVLAFAGCSIS